MSYVTNVILTCTTEDSGIQHVQNWLRVAHRLNLAAAHDIGDGPCCIEGEIWVGGINHLDIDGLLAAVKTAKWQEPDAVQLFCREQDFLKYKLFFP